MFNRTMSNNTINNNSIYVIIYKNSIESINKYDHMSLKKAPETTDLQGEISTPCKANKTPAWFATTIGGEGSQDGFRNYEKPRGKRLGTEGAFQIIQRATFPFSSVCRTHFSKKTGK